MAARPGKHDSPVRQRDQVANVALGHAELGYRVVGLKNASVLHCDSISNVIGFPALPRQPTRQRMLTAEHRTSFNSERELEKLAACIRLFELRAVRPELRLGAVQRTAVGSQEAIDRRLDDHRSRAQVAELG